MNPDITNPYPFTHTLSRFCTVTFLNNSPLSRQQLLTLTGADVFGVVVNGINSLHLPVSATSTVLHVVGSLSFRLLSCGPDDKKHQLRIKYYRSISR